MTKLLAAILVGLLFIASPALASDPREDQPRPDIFPVSLAYVPTDVDGDGDRDMQDLNPTNITAKATRRIDYRIVTDSGCNTGTIPLDLETKVATEFEKVNFEVVHNESEWDFTVHVSCGLTHIAKCGSIGVFCLPNGFPYNTDIYLSDVLSTYTEASRKSIPLHEFMHAIGTWNEQYATCAASCGFLPTPNWEDFMNTGPQSRVGFTDITLERWERTMYPLSGGETGPCSPFWDGVRWDQCNRTGYVPASDSWERQTLDGNWILEYGPCTTATHAGVRWRFNSIANRYVLAGSTIYLHEPDLRTPSTAPVC